MKQSRLSRHLDARRFAHRSPTDDGNSSYAGWAWDVVETPGGCEVTMSVDRSVASG